MRRPRSDSKLLNLPEGQQAQLAEWLLNGMPYHQAQALVEKEFSVSVSLPCFTSFWRAVCQPELLRRRVRAVETADAIASESVKSPGRLDKATLDALKQLAFNEAIKPGADPKAVKAIFGLILKSRDQDLDNRKIELLERKAAQAEQAEGTLKDSNLSDEEKAARMRQIFGLT